jgi:hypothetical protein
VFSWPGTGFLLNAAIFQRDLPQPDATHLRYFDGGSTQIVARNLDLVSLAVPRLAMTRVVLRCTRHFRDGSRAPDQFEADHVRWTTDRVSFGASGESALWALAV